MGASCELKGVDNVEHAINAYLSSIEAKVVNILKYAGEKAVAYARSLPLLASTT